MLFRSFLSWLADLQHRIILPLHVKLRTDKLIKLEFQGCNSAIVASLDQSGLIVEVSWKDRTWIIIHMSDILKQSTGSYNFEPFLKWVNEALAQAMYISIYYLYEQGIYGLELVNEPKPHEGGVVIIPIRTKPNDLNPDLDAITQG